MVNPGGWPVSGSSLSGASIYFRWLLKNEVSLSHGIKLTLS
jgi:hypothetical protein